MDLTSEDIHGLLDELIQRLKDVGNEGWIDVYGGSAVAHSHNERQVTQDIDSFLCNVGKGKHPSFATAEKPERANELFSLLSSLRKPEHLVHMLRGRIPNLYACVGSQRRADNRLAR